MTAVGGSLSADVVTARLAEQLAALRRLEPLVRADRPDAVHQMRVAARRLRAALATFGAVLDPDVTGPLDEELRRLARGLGAARDAEVVRARVLEQLAATEPSLVRGPVAARVEADLGERLRRGRHEAVTTLAGPAWSSLLARLDAFVAAPPWTDERLDEGALVARDWEGLDRRVREAVAEPDPDRRASRLHAARRAAKRVRYAAETVQPLVGDPARRLARAVTAVQTALGEHHDSVVARELLVRLADEAAARDEDAFTYGLLVGLELEAGRVAEARFAESWQEASHPELRAWLGPGS